MCTEYEFVFCKLSWNWFTCLPKECRAYHMLKLVNGNIRLLSKYLNFYKMTFPLYIKLCKSLNITLIWTIIHILFLWNQKFDNLPRGSNNWTKNCSKLLRSAVVKGMPRDYKMDWGMNQFSHLSILYIRPDVTLPCVRYLSSVLNP